MAQSIPVEPPVEFHTAEMVRALIQEDRAWPRYETLYGELAVTPAPGWKHQWIAGELFVALHAYLRREPVGVAFMSPADISWRRPDVLVQPDVFVVPPGLPNSARWLDVRHLMLAAETLSPTTARQDRFTKRRLYQQQGVPLYWILDADARHAEVWTPADDFPRFERERLTWHPEGAGTPFELALAALFRDS